MYKKSRFAIWVQVNQLPFHLPLYTAFHTPIPPPRAARCSQEGACCPLLKHRLLKVNDEAQPFCPKNVSAELNWAEQPLHSSRAGKKGVVLYEEVQPGISVEGWKQVVGWVGWGKSNIFFQSSKPLKIVSPNPLDASPQRLWHWRAEGETYSEFPSSSPTSPPLCLQCPWRSSHCSLHALGQWHGQG